MYFDLQYCKNYNSSSHYLTLIFENEFGKASSTCRVLSLDQITSTKVLLEKCSKSIEPIHKWIHANLKFFYLDLHKSN